MTCGACCAVTTIPAIMTRRDATWPAIAPGVLRTCTPSHKMPRAIEMTGSAEVRIAWTGARNVPSWNASWLSRKPAGPTTRRM